MGKQNKLDLEGNGGNGSGGLSGARIAPRAPIFHVLKD